MTHPCVKCGKELEAIYVLLDIVFRTCFNQSCPAYSFLQAGLEPVKGIGHFATTTYQEASNIAKSNPPKPFDIAKSLEKLS